MVEIRKWLKLKLFNKQKPAECYYCHGKLRYSKYTAKINIDKRKTPPVGAADLNIIRTKSIMFAEWYAKCQRCKASYIFLPSGSTYYYYAAFGRIRKNLFQLLPITNINDDFHSKVSNIRERHYNNDTLNISAETTKIDE
jgi:hypothetical protein